VFDIHVSCPVLITIARDASGNLELQTSNLELFNHKVHKVSQRKERNSLCNLCALRGSVVNNTQIILEQLRNLEPQTSNLKRSLDPSKLRVIIF